MKLSTGNASICSELIETLDEVRSNRINGVLPITVTTSPATARVVNEKSTEVVKSIDTLRFSYSTVPYPIILTIRIYLPGGTLRIMYLPVISAAAPMLVPFKMILAPING